MTVPSRSSSISPTELGAVRASGVHVPATPRIEKLKKPAMIKKHAQNLSIRTTFRTLPFC
jgi:hypothetical protein